MAFSPFKPKPKHRFANSVLAAKSKATSDSRYRKGNPGCGHCGGKKKKVYKQDG